jgi:5-methylcytosine-specific restriction endonuclease McrA
VPKSPNQVHCGKKCSARAGRRRDRANGTRQPTHRARARKWGRLYETIRPRDVFERDGWTCQICHRAVPKDKKVPHRLAPTLDHIIPMSREGGDHVLTNVRLAHFECNTKRGAATGEEAVQLLLVG